MNNENQKKLDIKGVIIADEVVTRLEPISHLRSGAAGSLVEGITWDSTNVTQTAQPVTAWVTSTRHGSNVRLTGQLGLKAITLTPGAWMALGVIDTTSTAAAGSDIARRLRPHAAFIARVSADGDTGFTASSTGASLGNTAICHGGGFISLAAGTIDDPVNGVASGAVDDFGDFVTAQAGCVPCMFRLITNTSVNKFTLQFLPLTMLAFTTTAVLNMGFSIEYPGAPLSSLVNDESV